MGVIVTGFVALACGAALHQSQSSPLPPSTAKAPEKVSTVGGDAPEASSANPSHFDLTAFQPILAQTRYREVAQAAQALDWETAATTLATLPLSEGASSTDVARYHYVLGMLQLHAGLVDLAGKSFEASAQAARDTSWPLYFDARLHQAEILLGAQKFDAAYAILEQARGAVDRPRQLYLEAQALDGLKRTKDAESKWGELVELTGHRTLAAGALPPADALSRQAQLSHARSLWALYPEAAETSKQQIAERAMHEASRSRLGLSDEEPLAARATALLVEIAAKSQVSLPTFDIEDALADLRSLIDLGSVDAANDRLATIVLDKEQTFSSQGCQLAYLKGKLRALERKWGEGADALLGAAKNCTQDAELHSWILFNAGKYAAADGRNSAAVGYYAELENLYPKSSLADDARLRAAKCYEEMGSVARYVALLSSMPEDYPLGDMTQEGVLLLALSEMQAHRYSTAASVLERASAIIRKTDSTRGHEFAGAERYFLARCQMELGEEEKALSEYESIISDVPLSYYMLHAYSRLLEADPPRAKAALEEALGRARSEPFSFPYRAEYDTPEFLRGIELLRVGDSERGRRLLSDNLNADTDDSLSWGIALLFDRAGETHHSYGVARGRLTDWLAHYPEGDWQHPWQIGFPRPYLSIVEKESQATGTPPWMIYGIMREESTFRPEVKSHASAYGLMQIIEPTARGIGKKAGLPYSPDALRRPAVNIAIGSRVLSELARRFKTNPLLAIPGYNAGPGRPSRWLAERPNIDFDMWVELIPYRETRRYTKRVLASRAAYAFTYYRDRSSSALVLPKRLQFK